MSDKNLPLHQENNSEVDLEKKNVNGNNNKAIIYVTTYKKGHMLGHYHWVHNGPLVEAVQEAKADLEKRHLKHLHTVPFLIDLKDDSNGPQQIRSELT